MDLRELLPPIYTGNTTMDNLQSALSDSVTSIETNFKDTVDNCFISTAYSLIERYEKIYGIAPDVTKSKDQRRERVIAKIRGFGTVTKQMIADVVSSFTNGDVEVIENPSSSSFIIRFVGTMGIPANMNDVIKTIDEIKPAHLNYSIEYKYRRWNEVSGTLWGSASSKTWYQFATGE